MSTVAVRETLVEPSKDTEPVTSPTREIVRAVCSFEAVAALPLTPEARAAATKAVVAIWVVLVPAAAVGARGTPVRVGEASGALALRPNCCAALAGPWSRG